MLNHLESTFEIIYFGGAKFKGALEYNKKELLIYGAYSFPSGKWSDLPGSWTFLSKLNYLLTLASLKNTIFPKFKAKKPKIIWLHYLRVVLVVVLLSLRLRVLQKQKLVPYCCQHRGSKTITVYYKASSAFLKYFFLHFKSVPRDVKYCFG